MPPRHGDPYLELLYNTLKDAVLSYLSEHDNPVPDYSHRRTLRDHLRELVDAPPEPTPKSK